jgi:PBP1b-binding outer membrane lipoprotein LpoB
VKFTARNAAAGVSVSATKKDELTQTIEREKKLKDEGLLSGGQKEMMAGADYFLTGKLSSISASSSRGVSDYILYTFKLIDAETTLEVWEDFTEIKKEGLDDVYYR